jgi:hypothetical protein
VLLVGDGGLPPPVAGFGGSAGGAACVADVEAFGCEEPHAVARVTARESASALTATAHFGRDDPGIGGAS